MKNIINSFSTISTKDQMKIDFHPTKIISGRGVYVTDEFGKELLDGMAGLWCVNIGYGREELAEEAKKQMIDLPYYHTFYGSSLDSTEKLSEELQNLTNHEFSKFFFCNSGSESVDSAIKIAHYIWKTKGKEDKKWIISRENSYHGSTIAATAIGGMNKMKCQLGNHISNIAHINHPFDHSLVGKQEEEDFARKRALELEEKILELGPENVAAFIAEPFQGAGGVMIPHKIYWEIIPEICKKYNILLIADEVIGGFGRLGCWFSYMHFGFQPDIFTFAKGLTSGYLPMGGVAVHKNIVNNLTNLNAQVFHHGFTYSGHPVCASVALKNIEILKKDKIIDHVKSISPYFKDKLKEAIETFPIIGSISSEGLVAGIQLLWDDDSMDLGSLCREEAYNQGIIMRASGNRLILSPPLIITKNEIDTLCQRIHETLKVVTSKIFSDKKLQLRK